MTNSPVSWRRWGRAIGFGAGVAALLTIAQASWNRPAVGEPAPFAASFGTRPMDQASGARGADAPAGVLTRPDTASAVSVAELEVQAGQPLYERFRWPLTITRTGLAADATAVGLSRSDGTSAGVIVVNGRGSLVQSIPGAEGPDGATVAADWLRARGWTPMASRHAVER